MTVLLCSAVVVGGALRTGGFHDARSTSFRATTIIAYQDKIIPVSTKLKPVPPTKSRSQNASAGWVAFQGPITEGVVEELSLIRRMAEPEARPRLLIGPRRGLGLDAEGLSERKRELLDVADLSDGSEERKTRLG